MDVLRSASSRRSFLTGAAALSLAPLLSACGRGGGGGPAHIVLGDQVHLLQAKLEAARALEGVGYDISWGNFSGATPLLEALNAGAVDTAPAGDLPVVLAAAAGCPLKVVAVTKSSPKSMAIIVPKGSPIRTVADLRGRSVMVSSARGSISHYLLLEALAEARVPVEQVKIGFMPPNDAAAAFAVGQIEAWAIFGIYQATAEAAGARILRDGAGIGPGYSLIAVSDKALADPAKRAAIADFLSRARKANDWCRANPTEYARIFSKQTGVPEKIASVMIARENPNLFAPDAAFVSTVQHAADRFRDYGVLPRPVDIASFVEPGLFKG